MGNRKWTADELEILRTRYNEDGPEAVAKAVGRTAKAVKYKAYKEKIIEIKRRYVRSYKLWTEEEENRLRWDWGTIPLSKIARSMNRTERSVYDRAKQLGLKMGCPPGWVRISHAAEKIGIDKKSLIRLLKEENVPIKKSWSFPIKNKKYSFLVVEFDLAVEAWERRSSKYQLSVMAKICGVSRTQLKMLMIASGAKPPAKNVPWWVSPDDAFRVVRKWLVERAGKKMCGHPPKITVEELDRRQADLMKKVKRA
jgi:hypothetical protein